MIPDRTDSSDSQVPRVAGDALPAAGEDVDKLTPDRRDRLRSGYFRGKKLRIGYCGQSLAAKVVNSDDQGLGVEISTPLEIDSSVSFVGIGLRGRAQVVHCRPNDDGVFRVGLKLEAVSFRKLDVSSRALPSETIKAHAPRVQLLNAGANGEPKADGTDDHVEAVEEMHLAGAQDSSEEKSQANVSEPSTSQLARVSTQEETATDSAGQSSSPDREGQASTILSKMAQTISQAVEVALLNLELHRADEIKAVRQELRDFKLNEIVQGWTETQQQIAELKANVSEQRAEVEAAKQTLSRLSEEKQRRTVEPVPDQTEAPETSEGKEAAELPAANRSTPPQSRVETAEEEPEIEPTGAPAVRQRWIASRVSKLAAACVAVVLAVGVAHWISSGDSSQQTPKVAASTIAPEAAVAVPLRGVVLDESSGRPITHATLYSGGVEVRTNARGEFELPPDAHRGALGVKAAGYRQRTLKRLEDPLTVRLEAIQVRAIYASQARMAHPEGYQAIGKLLDETPLNTLVIAVKSPRGRLIVPVEPPTAEPLGAYRPVWQGKLAEEIRSLKQRGVYTIAYIATFRDNLVARGAPELALKRPTGRPVRDASGLGWTNPVLKPVRDYNLAVAKAAAEAGFDEIQFDFVHYPVDRSGAGGVDAAEHPRRLQAAAEFLRAAHRMLVPYNVYVSATIFGSACSTEQVTVVGQKLEEFAAAVDYVCPMLYPSAFRSSPSSPDPLKRSYELVEQSLMTAAGRLGGQSYKLRPWLQNFAPNGSSARGIDAETIALQIRAAVDSRSSGWMLWDRTSRYRKTREALSIL